MQKDGKNIMVVDGANKEQVLQAGRYLADVRLNFKAGAYKTFFSFVALRGYVEKGEFEHALRLIKSPTGLSACGKNMALAGPMVAQWGDDLKAVVRNRNNILYNELPKALEAKDKEKAVSLWKQAMYTCYQCQRMFQKLYHFQKYLTGNGVVLIINNVSLESKPGRISEPLDGTSLGIQGNSLNLWRVLRVVVLTALSPEASLKDVSIPKEFPLRDKWGDPKGHSSCCRGQGRSLWVSVGYFWNTLMGGQKSCVACHAGPTNIRGYK